MTAIKDILSLLIQTVPLYISSYHNDKFLIHSKVLFTTVTLNEY